MELTKTSSTNDAQTKRQYQDTINAQRSELEKLNGELQAVKVIVYNRLRPKGQLFELTEAKKLVEAERESLKKVTVEEYHKQIAGWFHWIIYICSPSKG